MTPEQLREAAAVMLAAADGKAIEYRSKFGGTTWEFLTCPVWDFDSWEYRIKPKPRKVKVCLFKSQHGEIEPFRVDTAVGRVCTPVSDIVEIEVKE